MMHFQRLQICVPLLWWWVQILLAALRIQSTNALSSNSRRNFLASHSHATIIASTSFFSFALPDPAAADNTEGFQIISSLFDSKTIQWTGPSWTASRYRSSTLALGANDNAAPVAASGITRYPDWMEGYFEIRYKFISVSFPQGRSVPSLRTAGAGLGSCLSIPNVGYSPSASHALRYLRDPAGLVYPDAAYNAPRTLESFWPQSKVNGVQTDGNRSTRSKSGQEGGLTPKCFLTGEGCTIQENPNLHYPSSRVVLNYVGPSRRNSSVQQSIDVTLLESSFSSGTTTDGMPLFATAQSYSQWNAQQNLQTFYRQVSKHQELENGDILGQIRVAAFLPRYIQQLDTKDDVEYNDQESVAIYDYKIFMIPIDATEAGSL